MDDTILLWYPLDGCFTNSSVAKSSTDFLLGNHSTSEDQLWWQKCGYPNDLPVVLVIGDHQLVIHV